MKTYEEILSKLKCLPVTMALHNLCMKRATKAELSLLGNAITGDPNGNYQIEFNFNKKTVSITHGWSEEKEVYYTVSCFYLKDVYQGLTQ